MDKGVRYTHTGILLSLKKERNLAICNNITALDGITLSEISQTEKDKYHIIPLVCGILNKLKHRELVVARDKG